MVKAPAGTTTISGHLGTVTERDGRNAGLNTIFGLHGGDFQALGLGRFSAFPISLPALPLRLGCLLPLPQFFLAPPFGLGRLSPLPIRLLAPPFGLGRLSPLPIRLLAPPFGLGRLSPLPIRLPALPLGLGCFSPLSLRFLTPPLCLYGGGLGRRDQYVRMLTREGISCNVALRLHPLTQLVGGPGSEQSIYRSGDRIQGP